MEIKFKIKLNRSTFDPNTLLGINSLNLSVVRIDKFGVSEPLKNTLSSNNEREIVELWDEYCSIIFKNKKDFNFYAQADRSGIITCTGNLKVKSYNDEKIKSLISFIDIFKKNDSLLFAFFIDEDNYDIKHKTIDEHSYGWLGSSNSDFHTYLPGVYWYTLFGKNYVDCIGKNRLENIEGVTYTCNENGIIAFHIDNNTSHGETSLLEKIEEVEKQIGENYFYSKYRNVKNLQHPKGFREFLKSLER